jgi:hypothetical protein
MGCSCKQVKKLQKMMSVDSHVHEKKGILKIIWWIWEALLNTLTKLAVACLVLVLTPLVVLALLVSLVFEGKGTIHLPKRFFRAAMKQQEEDEGEESEQEEK